jgi:hypothetical protein
VRLFQFARSCDGDDDDDLFPSTPFGNPEEGRGRRDPAGEFSFAIRAVSYACTREGTR